jgi:putative transposase
LFWSFCYVVLGRVLQLAALRFRSGEFKELEIVVLRHELAVLRRQAGRAELRAADRVFLAAASRQLPRSSWRSFVVTPTTLLRWPSASREALDVPGRVDRPPIGSEIRRRCKLACNSPAWLRASPATWRSGRPTSPTKSESPLKASQGSSVPRRRSATVWA